MKQASSNPSRTSVASGMGSVRVLAGCFEAPLLEEGVELRFVDMTYMTGSYYSKSI